MTIVRKTYLQRLIEAMEQVPPQELTPEQMAAIAALVDISTKVDKITNYSLVANTEIAKLTGLPNITVGAIEPENPEEGDLWFVDET